MERIIKRGDIYYAELHPLIGLERGGHALYLSFLIIQETDIALS